MDGCVSLLMLWHFGSFHFGVGNQKVLFSSLLASPFQAVSFLCFDVLFLKCMLVFCFFVLSQVFAFVYCILQFVMRSQGNSSWMVVFHFLCCGILVDFILALEIKKSFFPLCLLLHFKLWGFFCFKFFSCMFSFCSDACYVFLFVCFWSRFWSPVTLCSVRFSPTNRCWSSFCSMKYALCSPFLHVDFCPSINLI